MESGLEAMLIDPIGVKVGGIFTPENVLDLRDSIIILDMDSLIHREEEALGAFHSALGDPQKLLVVQKVLGSEEECQDYIGASLEVDLWGIFPKGVPPRVFVMVRVNEPDSPQARGMSLSRILYPRRGRVH